MVDKYKLKIHTAQVAQRQGCTYTPAPCWDRDGIILTCPSSRRIRVSPPTGCRRRRSPLSVLKQPFVVCGGSRKNGRREAASFPTADCERRVREISLLRSAPGSSESLSVTMDTNPSVVASVLAGLAALYVLTSYLWLSKRSVSPLQYICVSMELITVSHARSLLSECPIWWQPLHCVMPTTAE